MMDDITSDFCSEYFSELCMDFDESTLIASNKNGEKEKGLIEKSEYEIKVIEECSIIIIKVIKPFYFSNSIFHNS